MLQFKSLKYIHFRMIHGKTYIYKDKEISNKLIDMINENIKNGLITYIIKFNGVLV